MNYTYEEVVANRRKWIDYLKSPEPVKTIGCLDVGGNRRCCLGHGCHILGLPSTEAISTKGETVSRNGGIVRSYRGSEYEGTSHTHVPPRKFIEMVGIRSATGTFRGVDLNKAEPSNEVVSLASLNDKTELTSQEIGQFIEDNYDLVFLNEDEYQKASFF